jgi:hypothetical protein
MRSNPAGRQQRLWQHLHAPHDSEHCPKQLTHSGRRRSSTQKVAMPRIDRTSQLATVFVSALVCLSWRRTG